MPTRAQMDAVIERLETLEAKYSGLSLAELALATDELDWEGFSESDRRSVEMRIFQGEGPDFWLDDVQPEDGMPIPTEYAQMNREIRDNESQRPLHEKGVDYSDRLYGETIVREFEVMFGDVVSPPDFGQTSDYEGRIQEAARMPVSEPDNSPDR